MGSQATCFVPSRGNEKSAVQGHAKRADFESRASVCARASMTECDRCLNLVTLTCLRVCVCLCVSVCVCVRDTQREGHREKTD